MPFWSRFSRRSGRPTITRTPRHTQRHAADVVPELLDALEQRLSLYSSPFLASLPTTSMMEHAENTVIRMQTSAGSVDIELYNVRGPGSAPAAPNTAANFLRYINNGLLDGTFFHRLTLTDTDGLGILQGGGFTFNPSTSKADSVTTFPPINNEFDTGRSNISRTIAMAKTSDPNSATSQFYFNVDDNSEALDNPANSGGFSVFGRVIQGWDVITTISAAQRRDLNQFLTGSASGAFGTVPLSGTSNTDLFTITDIEVIKAANQNFFYNQSVYFPDAFRSGKSTDTISLVNPDANASSVYQIIARFEGGLRDKVIQSGILAPGAHVDVPIYKSGDPSINNVRAQSPFAYEVRATQEIGASINHKDFGAVAGESFVAPQALSAANLEAWSFANGQKGAGLGSFLTFLNLSDQPAQVTAVFYAENGTSFLITKNVDAYRRGGLDVNQLVPVPDGLYSVRVVSSQPIVAALSQYRAAPSRASMETGQIAGGATQGLLPGAIVPTSGQSIISLLYAADAPATITVDFDFILTDGTILHNAGAVNLTTSQRRQEIDLSTANGAIPRGQFFTIRYKVRNNAAPISASYTSVVNGDVINTPFQSASNQTLFFADGFTDPSPGLTNNEVLSIFNPYTDPGTTLNYRVRIHFVDNPQGDIVIPGAGSGTLGANGRVDIPIRSLAEALQKIEAGSQFRHYSITVDLTPMSASIPQPGAGFAQLTRLDPQGNTITTGPTLSPGQMAVFANDPRFQGP